MTTPKTQRRNAASGGSGWAWQRIRAGVLARDPWCSLCGKDASTVVDHILPISQGGTSDVSNLRGVCSPCNQARNRTAALRKRPPERHPGEV